MGRGVDTPWEGVDMPSIEGQNAMGRGVNIPWVEGSIYHG